MTTPRRYLTRPGFTIVELLVVMTVIAILVGMLMAAVIPAMSAAKRARILMEMKQIEQSIENFKTKNGFYPPSWVKFRAAAALQQNENDGDIAAANYLLQYINRIAPNNQEGVGNPGSRPIDAWWQAVGKNVDHREGQDLVFWLSALSKNKQFPLTNDGTATPKNAYDDQTYEREVFYEFKSAQLEIDGLAATYMQQPGDLAPFLYIDAKSYPILAGKTESEEDGFTGYYVQNPNGKSFENPKTFQLICWGLDKLALDPDIPNPYPTRWATQDASGNVSTAAGFGLGADKYASDNLCNFCDGMLDRYLSGNFDSPAIK